MAGSGEGAYLLRANLTADSAAELWKKYIQLTEVEAAFRTLKSELAIRPLFHQLEKRVKAHVLVAFLGYALNAPDPSTFYGGGIRGYRDYPTLAMTAHQ